MINFFIIGTQRSGTTLLRLILNNHSKIAIPEEGTFLMPLLNHKYINYVFRGKELNNLINYIKNNPQFKIWNKDFSSYFDKIFKKGEISTYDFINGLYKFYCDLEGKEIVGDKTPSFFRKIDILNKFFKDAKFIHIVRDGRDVFNSWRNINKEMNNVAVVALEWVYKLNKIEESFSKISSDKKIIIRYEDLLDEPEKILKSLCNFLEIEYEDGLLNFYKSSKKYIGSHHSKLIFKPLNKSNKYKWKKLLNEREINCFTLIARKKLNDYKYEIIKGYNNLFNYIYTFFKLLYGLPLRILRVLKFKFLYEISLKKGKKIDESYFGKKPEE